jgi:hypothetical protein
MKMVLFVGEQADYGLDLIDYLKQHGFYSIKTSNVDEIDQTGQQAEKAILIFTDHKFAYRFLMENKWNQFPYICILYLNKNPIITEDAKKKLAAANLHIYLASDKIKLREKLEHFYATAEDGSSVNEIEFSVHEELGKKRKA